MTRMKFPVFAFLLFALLFTLASPAAHAAGLLTDEETLWLSSRRNTIVVYPEKNNPPFSYETASGTVTGLAIDYMKLVAEKIGAKLEYLTPRSHRQVVDDLAAGKGDVAITMTENDNATTLLFTEPYVTVPVSIVVRKDTPAKAAESLADFTGKRVAMVDGSAIESFVHENYPRVVVENVTDDEIALQQVVLGEVDAAAIDVASLSFLLSKQILSSVKVVGDTGLDYEMGFAVSKDKEILQAILEKGLSQISAADREMLAEKWVALPGSMPEKESLLDRLSGEVPLIALAALAGVGIAGILFLPLLRKRFFFLRPRKQGAVEELKGELGTLQAASRELTGELEQVKHLEEHIQEKLEHLQEP